MRLLHGSRSQGSVLALCCIPFVRARSENTCRQGRVDRTESRRCTANTVCVDVLLPIIHSERQIQYAAMPAARSLVLASEPILGHIVKLLLVQDLLSAAIREHHS